MEVRFKGTLQEFKALFGAAPGLQNYVFESSDGFNLPVEDEISEGPAASLWSTSGLDKPEDEVQTSTVSEVLAKLPKITPEQSLGAAEVFKEFCIAWDKGFEDPETEQPDRQQMMIDLGQHRYAVAILVLAYRRESLQGVVLDALVTEVVAEDFGDYEEYLDYIDRLAGNMVQISHSGFPELAGTYDYTNRWRRNP